MRALVTKVPVAIGLAFDIERDPTRKSGYRPAELHLGSDEPLGADLRLEGFAAALRLGFTEKLIIPGKDERRYKGGLVEIEGKPQLLWQGWAIKQMLVHDLGIDAARVEWIPSTGTTRDAIKALQERNLISVDCPIITSQYHALRAMRFVTGGLPTLYAAEEFLLAATNSKEEWQAVFGRIRKRYEEFLVQRTMRELEGLEKLLTGEYEAQTKGW